MKKLMLALVGLVVSLSASAQRISVAGGIQAGDPCSSYGLQCPQRNGLALAVAQPIAAMRSVEVSVEGVGQWFSDGQAAGASFGAPSLGWKERLSGMGVGVNAKMPVGYGIKLGLAAGMMNWRAKESVSASGVDLGSTTRRVWKPYATVSAELALERRWSVDLSFRSSEAPFSSNSLRTVRSTMLGVTYTL